MLKKLLGALRTTQIDLVFCAGELLHFRCASSLGMGPCNVRARLPEGQAFRCRVDVQHQDPKTRLYVGTLIEPKDAVLHLKGLLPLPFEDRRISPRIERVVRVLSPQVQGYSALTRDISEDGCCLVLGQIVEPGGRIQIELDVDAADNIAMRIEAEARWSAPDLISGKNLLGCRFLNLQPRQQRQLKMFLATVSTNQRSAPPAPDTPSGVLPPPPPSRG